MMIQALHDHLELISGIVGSAAAIAGVPWLRRFAIGLAIEIWNNLTVGSKFVAFQREVRGRLANIEREVQHNGGGSMKDWLARVESFRRHAFWCQPRPAMELDGQGQVERLSEGCCRLFRVVNPEEATRRSWLRFLDGTRVEDFIDSFCEITLSDSHFQFPIRIQSADGEARGQWEFRAVPIKPDVGGKKLYSGYWAPLDEVAKDVAKRNRWV